MAIDPQARAIGEMLTQEIDITQLDLAAVREQTDVAARQGPRPDVARVEDHLVPGPAGDIPVRIYRPEAASPLPGLVFFHGGGWALCSIETHDVTCRELANGAGCVVVSVGYRLAPEHRYPAAADDAYAALCWVAENGTSLGVDVARLAVGGDSAGGNLASVVSLMARDRQGPALRHQLLVYPVTHRCFDTDSYRENADGPLLTRAMMEAFWDWYLEKESQGREAYASPLLADDHSGLPPALVITAEFDPLRDEGEAYALRLREAGVVAALRRYDGMIHGFFAMGAVLPAAREAVAEASSALRSALA